MKSRRIILSISNLLLVAILAVCLTACLKIGMREKNIVDRLTEAGAVITYERTTPMTAEGQAGYNIGDIVHANMFVEDRVDGETADVEENLYIFFAQDARSADWVESVCKKYLSENADDHKGWKIYRYEEVVMIGHYKILAIARQY